MNAPRIVLTSTGDHRSGYLVAVMPAPDSYTSGARLVVGDVYRNSADGEPANWRAWLWPAAGGSMHTTQSCDAVDAPTPERLWDKLQKRVSKDGPWWGEAA